VYTETQDNFEYRFLDSITVKGKRKPLKIYELLSEKGSLSAKQKTITKKFQKALDMYISQDFQKAKLLFNELIDM